jgi:hypothetical protein
VYTFSSDVAANFTTLKLWARNSGGEFFNLNENFSTSEIVARVGKSPFGFLSASFDSEEIGETYVPFPT